jgi:hypothetical protein
VTGGEPLTHGEWWDGFIHRSPREGKSPIELAWQERERLMAGLDAALKCVAAAAVALEALRRPAGSALQDRAGA